MFGGAHWFIHVTRLIFNLHENRFWREEIQLSLKRNIFSTEKIPRPIKALFFTRLLLSNKFSERSSNEKNAHSTVSCYSLIWCLKTLPDILYIIILLSSIRVSEIQNFQESFGASFWAIWYIIFGLLVTLIQYQELKDWRYRWIHWAMPGPSVPKVFLKIGVHRPLFVLFSFFSTTIL